VEDKDWEREWMDDFRPLQFGSRLWIVPSWHQPPDPDAANLSLDPGLAFGTGTHPTTALCLEWLDGQDVGGQQVIDYGCGSGILGLAALLLGADHVTGVDTDQQALEASRENARRNEVDESRLDLYLPGDEPGTVADVMLANILAQPLIGLAPHLAGKVKAGGHLVLSGILSSQAREVMAAYEPWFIMDEPEQREEWIRLTGRRNDR
jgi:ribosomal protein L11 methyltransferase